MLGLRLGLVLAYLPACTQTAGEAAAFSLLADAQQMASKARERVSEADAHIHRMMSHGSPGLSALNTYIAQRKQKHDSLTAECNADKLAIQSLEALRTLGFKSSLTLKHDAASVSPLKQAPAQPNNHSWRAHSTTLRIRRLLKATSPATGYSAGGPQQKRLLLNKGKFSMLMCRHTVKHGIIHVVSPQTVLQLPCQTVHA